MLMTGNSLKAGWLKVPILAFRHQCTAVNILGGRRGGAGDQSQLIFWARLRLLVIKLVTGKNIYFDHIRTYKQTKY